MFLDGAHLRFCLRHAHAEMQPGNGDDCGCAARVEQKRVALRERRADFHWVIWFIVKTKMWRKDSDNRVVHSAQGQILPRAFASPPNRFLQNRSLMITTRDPPRWSSCGEKLRPRGSSTPNVSKKLEETSAARICSGAPGFVRS